MIFFNVLIILGILISMFSKKFTQQVTAYSVMIIGVIILLLTKENFILAGLMIFVEFLFIRLMVMSLGNSREYNYPSFKIFKKDINIKITIILLMILIGQMIILLSKYNQNLIKISKLNYLDLSNYYLVFATTIFMIIMIKRKKNV